MTIYYATPYMVGGLHTHGGDREVHYDPMPADLKRVWEIDPYEPSDTRPWVRNAGGFWIVEGDDEGFELEWEELLDEFGPVSDDEADAAIGLEALETRVRLAELDRQVQS